jgi:hypothetical protein
VREDPLTEKPSVFCARDYDRVRDGGEPRTAGRPSGTVLWHYRYQINGEPLPTPREVELAEVGEGSLLLS